MNTTALILAGVGSLLWLIAAARSSIKKTNGISVVKSFFDFFTPKHFASDKNEPASANNSITIDSLETELGILPDAYLCDRIARINEALIARKEGTKTKKGGAK